MKNFYVVLSVFFLFSIEGFTQTKGIVNFKGESHQISEHIYGHFSEHLGRCIYGGLWVGEDSSIPNTDGIRKSALEALRDVNIPNLRWPGGCFADEYHWKEGIGPKDERPPMINTHWGMVSEDNSFGTHEFLKLCNLLDAEPVIAGNMGSGTVQELSDWVEYVNAETKSSMTQLRKKHGKEEAWYVKYWGVGNESWGCGGNMNPEQYYDKMCRYSTYMRDYPEKPLYKVAVGPSGFNLDWTERFMKQVAKNGKAHLFDGYSLHYYTLPGNWEDKGSATDFTEKEWFTTMREALRIEELITKNIRIIDKYIPEANVDIIVDEWGCWYDAKPGTNPAFLYQQNTVRDAMVAGLTLNIFNQYGDRIKMANLAQTANVLQTMILTKDEEMVLTPTYHVFDMYQVHQNATYVPVKLSSTEYSMDDTSIPAVTASASKDEDGTVHITFTNLDPNSSSTVQCQFKGGDNLSFNSGEVLTHNKMNAHNTFDSPQKVTIQDFEDAEVNNGELTAELPSKSVVMIELE